MRWLLSLGATLAWGHQHTSTLERRRASRLLEPWEIDASCNFTFATYQEPSDDYFRGAACDTQLHLSLASKRSALVSYVSASARTSSRVRFGTRPGKLDRVAFGRSRSYTSLMSVDPYLSAPALGEAFASPEEIRNVVNTTAWASPSSSSWYEPTSSETPNGLLLYKNPGAVYSSPVVHTVVLEDLLPGRRYYYALPASADDGDLAGRSFVFPKDEYPFRVGLTADVGQTVVSNRTFGALAAMEPDVALLAGDLSYADGWPFRWDTFGKLAERLAATVPLLVTGGNHEIGSSENWLHFLERWPTPFEASGSTSPLYWSVDAGPVHVVALNSYDNFVRTGDRLQRSWVMTDLAGVDRRATPWVVVVMHVPFYTSNYAHPGEAELMRRAYEPIFYAFGVDLVVAGHVHAYERSANGVYDGRLDECAPLFLTLGDGGNRENVAAKWADPQPVWSLFRESSFGVGKLDVLDERTAQYEWRRHACADDGAGANFDDNCVSPLDDSGATEAVDALTITRPALDDPICQPKRRTILDALRMPDDGRPIPSAKRGRGDHRRSSRMFAKTLLALVAAASCCFGGALAASRAFRGEWHRGDLLVKGITLPPFAGPKSQQHFRRATTSYTELPPISTNTYALPLGDRDLSLA